MKHYKFIIVAISIGIFWSCEPPVVFSEPQPKDVDALTLIPKHFQGSYWCDKDSVGLYVDEHLIYKNKLFDVTVSRQEINDSEDITLVNGQLFSKRLNDSFPAFEKNGTIFSTITLKDTLFSNRRAKDVLKYSKGYLVLNNQISTAHWEVKIISLKPEGSLSISKVNYPENLTELKTITTVKIIERRDREQILVSPTKTEFNQILDKNLIFTGNCQEFKPVMSFEK